MGLLNHASPNKKMEVTNMDKDLAIFKGLKEIEKSIIEYKKMQDNLESVLSSDIIENGYRINALVESVTSYWNWIFELIEKFNAQFPDSESFEVTIIFYNQMSPSLTKRITLDESNWNTIVEYLQMSGIDFSWFEYEMEV
jgi:hypothetical protein